MPKQTRDSRVKDCYYDELGFPVSHVCMPLFNSLAPGRNAFNEAQFVSLRIAIEQFNSTGEEGPNFVQLNIETKSVIFPSDASYPNAKGKKNH